MRDRINKCYKERGGTLTTATTIIVLFSSLSRRIKKTEIKKSFQKNQQQQQKKNSINRTDRPKARTVRRLEWRPMIDRVFDCATTTSTSILVPLFLVFFCLFFFGREELELGCYWVHHRTHWKTTTSRIIFLALPSLHQFQLHKNKGLTRSK